MRRIVKKKENNKNEDIDDYRRYKMEQKYSAALISLGSVSSKLTLEAMKKYFKRVEHIDIRKIEVNLDSENPMVLYKGKQLPTFDCIYAKGSFRYVTLLRSLTSVLNKISVMPIVSEAFTLGHDKLLTQLQLQSRKIPMPKTYISSTTSAAKEILEKINFPIIMKFPHGTGGKGVMFADSYTSAVSVLDALASLKQPFLIQEFIETNGVDTRAIVIGDKVVAAMKRRQPNPLEIRSNTHSGGVGEYCILDSNSKKLAIRAAKAIGADICGIDLLDGIRGPLVIEVNLSPGLQGIIKASKLDLPDMIAQYLYKKTVEIKSKEDNKISSTILKEIDIGTEGKEEEIITNLDFKGDKIILPDILTRITHFDEDDEVVIKAANGTLSIKKFKMNGHKD